MIDLETAYREHRGTVDRTIATFRRRFGGDPDELLSEAIQHFIKAVQTWDPEKGKLKARITYCVFNGLLDSLRSRRNIPLHYSLDFLKDMPSQPRFDPERFCWELSEDEAFVVRAALRTGARNRVHKRHNLINNLMDLGWRQQRVLDVLAQVKENLD